MFYDGYPNKGRCPAGGGHVAQGYDFFLHYDDNRRRGQTQYDWRFCNKCHTMFWNGDRANKGRCPAGGPHFAQGFMFGLHFTNETVRTPPSGANFQGSWRFCGKCMALFFDGYPNKGRCPAGGGHAALGWTFHLAFKEGPPVAAGKVEDRINAAFRGWLGVNRIANASLAVMRDGTLVGHFGYNERGPDVTVPVASLSKAITGVAIATLVDGRRLGFQDTLGSRLRNFLTINPPRDRRALNITIEQLLRHRSGLETDPTQGGFAGIPNLDSADATIARRALSVALPQTPGSRHFYNNANYALLGMVIREVTGEPYEAYCRRIVLAPRGAPGARIGAGLRGMGAFGGWEVSASEYANFARAFDPRARLLSAQAHRFINTGTGSPYYALGVRVVRTASGRNVFHFGDWQSNATTPNEIGAFFALWDNGVSVVANYDRHVPDAARTALDNALRTAAYGR